MQPGAGHGPVALDGGQAHVQRQRHFVVFQAAEKAQFDDLGGARVHLFKGQQRLVHGHLLATAPRDCQAFFFRSAAGAEIDLLIQCPNGERWAIEVKRSLAPKLERGFHAACADVLPTHKWVVDPGTERYRLGEDAWAVSLQELTQGLRTLQPSVGLSARAAA